MGGDVNVFLCNEQYGAVIGEMNTTLESIAKIVTLDEDVKPTIDLFRFNNLMINNVLKDMINGSETEVVKNYSECAPDEFKLLSSIAGEFQELINNVLMDIEFKVLAITLVSGDNFKVRVRLDPNEL